MKEREPNVAFLDSETIACLKTKVLEQHMDKICQCIQPKQLFPFMRSAQAFTKIDCDDVMKENTPHDQSYVFMELIIKKGTVACNAFWDALYESRKYTYILSHLNEAFEEKRIALEAKWKFQAMKKGNKKKINDQDIPTDEAIPTFVSLEENSDEEMEC